MSDVLTGPERGAALQVEAMFADVKLDRYAVEFTGDAANPVAVEVSARGYPLVKVQSRDERTAIEIAFKAVRVFKGAT